MSSAWFIYSVKPCCTWGHGLTKMKQAIRPHNAFCFIQIYHCRPRRFAVILNIYPYIGLQGILSERVLSCRACEALKNCLPDLLQNSTFNNCLRVWWKDLLLEYCTFWNLDGVCRCNPIGRYVFLCPFIHTCGLGYVQDDVTTRRWLQQLMVNVGGQQMHPQRVPSGLQGVPLEQLLSGP